MRVRYFQLVNWRKWYPRYDYKSMPWVKLSTKFFEDPKQDDLSPIEKLAIIWLITEAGRQNIGEGKIRVDCKLMASSLRVRGEMTASTLLNSAVRIGVIIEETYEVTTGIRSLDLDFKRESKNPLNPLTENQEETGNVRSIISSSLGGKEL